MQIRRRRNRAARAARRASPLSFRCQTHLTPMTATFPEGSGGEQEKAFVDLSAAALGSNPVSSWQSHDNMRSHAGLHSITTSIPKPPAPAVAIPHMTSPRIQSPDDYFQTPTSTTSNAPLLASFRPYVPSDYNAGGQLIPGVAVSIPQETSSPSFSPRQPQQQQRSPRIGGTSPRVEQRGWYDRPSQPAWTPQNPTEGATRDLAKGKRAISGSPVSASTIQTSFPPPPMR